MPKFLLFFGVLIALTVFAADTSKTGSQAPGRFQLVPATIDIGTKQGGSIESKFIFRIDTATGEISYFHYGYTSDGEALEFWKPIPASIQEAIRIRKETEENLKLLDLYRKK